MRTTIITDTIISDKNFYEGQHLDYSLADLEGGAHEVLKGPEGTEVPIHVQSFVYLSSNT